MADAMTTKEWEAELGAQLRSLRLRRELDQRQLSQIAGVALNAVKNLESGKGARLTSLIKIVRVLGRADWLKSLAPEVSISPLQLLKTKAPRQRASRRRKGTHV
jgi:transcriptional regulator with XRE-family HTH domain